MIPLFKAPAVTTPDAANPGQAVDFNAAMATGPAAGNAIQPAVGATPVATPAPEIVNKLFRFVDLTAVPGKTYRYQVQLVLANPNYVNPIATNASVPLMERHLAKAEFGKKPRRETEWSDPSPPITIPSAHRILGESISIAGGRGADPKAKIDILKIAKVDAASAPGAPAPAPAPGAVPAPGAAPAPAAAPAAGGAATTPKIYLEVMKDTEVLLGGVAYLEDATINKAFDPTIEQTRDLKNVTLDTNQSTLLDIRNDDPLGIGPKSKGPAEMLFFEPRTGKLVVVNSAVDSAAKKLYKDRTTPSTDPVR